MYVIIIKEMHSPNFVYSDFEDSHFALNFFKMVEGEEQLLELLLEEEDLCEGVCNCDVPV